MAPTPYDRLRAMVIRGVLGPGTAVSEATLATRLKVSRTPVRQAMQRLLAEGLLVVTGGGARPRVAVAPLDRDEARECYHAVGVLEATAARAIASWPAATRAALAAELTELDEEFKAAVNARRPNADQLYDKHAAFHERLRAACVGPVLKDLLVTLAPRLERYQWFHAPLIRKAGLGFEPTYTEHAAIIKAVRSGDAETLERWVRANWDQAADRLIAAMDHR